MKGWTRDEQGAAVRIPGCKNPNTKGFRMDRKGFYDLLMRFYREGKITDDERGEIYSAGIKSTFEIANEKIASLENALRSAAIVADDRDRWQLRANEAEATLRHISDVCDEQSLRHPDPSGQACDYHCVGNVIADVRGAMKMNPSPRYTVSREGEVGSRSATKPNANLAGPEGDARPTPHRHDKDKWLPRKSNYCQDCYNGVHLPGSCL